MDLACTIESRIITPARVPARVQLVRWIAPDATALMAMLTLFLSLFLFSGSQRFFLDADTGWHIRTGESLLTGSGWPHADPYSFSRPGAAWYAWEWGTDAMMGAAHRLDGLSGVALLYAVAISSCTWLWFRVHWAAGGNFLIACAMASLMISTANAHWLARPHVFGWIFALLAVWYAETAVANFAFRTIATAAAFGALWANMHASFMLGPSIAIIYSASFFLRPLVWNLDRAAEWHRARFHLTLGAAVLAGSLVNPYGWQLHRHVATYLLDADLIARVGEFQSFNFHLEGATQILLCLGVAAVGGVLALTQRNLAQFLLAAAVLASALRSARGLPLVALLLLPQANAAITRSMEAARDLRPGIARAVSNFSAYSNNLRTLDAGLRGYALFPLAILIAFAGLHSSTVHAQTGFPASEFPVDAAALIERLPPTARILATDKFGGYLIYRFSGTRPVFFDGRSDFYGSAFMKEYLRMMEVRPGWQELLARNGFTHALLPNQSSLIPALREEGWTQIYSDNTATLLEKR